MESKRADDRICFTACKLFTPSFKSIWQEGKDKSFRRLLPESLFGHLDSVSSGCLPKMMQSHTGCKKGMKSFRSAAKT